jgi:N-acetylmuramic acid 6-phosphate (MurNAc-6-P) etherase
MVDFAEANDVFIPQLGTSFRGVLKNLEEEAEFKTFGLTLPKAGPEILRGSTRMKGGTATAMVLDALCQSLVDASRAPSLILKDKVEKLRRIGLDPALAEIIEEAAEVIKRGNDIIYVGSGDFARVATLDASECPPTFGVSKHKVRVADISENAAEALAAVQIQEGDLVIVIGKPEIELSAYKNVVHINPADFESAKLFLNAITTGAFSRAGYVFGCEMINVQISNAKLFKRATEIISKIADVDTLTAQKALVAALTKNDNPDISGLEQKVADICLLTRPLVVPTAILMACGNTFIEAEGLLAGVGTIREIVENYKMKKT